MFLLEVVGRVRAGIINRSFVAGYVTRRSAMTLFLPFTLKSGQRVQLHIGEPFLWLAMHGFGADVGGGFRSSGREPGYRMCGVIGRPVRVKYRGVTG